MQMVSSLLFIRNIDLVIRNENKQNYCNKLREQTTKKLLAADVIVILIIINCVRFISINHFHNRIAVIVITTPIFIFSTESFII